MRYLFGDSVPFPQQYNFLSTLEAFVVFAAKALVVDAELGQLKGKSAAEAEVRNRSMAALEAFHQGVVRHINDSLTRSAEPLNTQYARQLQDVAAQGVEGARKACKEANEREQAAVRGDLERKRTEIRAAIDTFLRVAAFPPLHHSLALRVDNASCRAIATLTLPKGISARFNLAVSQVREWTVPRRVSDFSEGLVLKVGLKKGWMKKSVELEPLQLDDLLISGFDLDETTAEIRLRRRIEQEDAFVFRARRAEDKSFADVARPLDEGPEAHASALEPEDRAALERLWMQLRTASAELLPHRDSLISVALDGQELFEHDRIVAFIERIVELLAPTLVEVDRRSPNPEELSLKVEDERGRREEIYLRKSELSSKLEALPSDLRAVFDPLGLGGAELLSATDVAIEVG